MMCFSATASFTTAAILIPSGLYCIRQFSQLDKTYWAFAMLPFLFGLQQLFEGGVWVSILSGNIENARIYGLAFLLFSHVFWLGWVAFSAYLIETSITIKRIFIRLSIFGVLFGISMYIPLMYNPEWLTISVLNHSIRYDLVFIYDEYVPQQFLAVMYALIILFPLLLSSDQNYETLGILIFISGLLSWLFFSWVLISVWCYFAAIISIYVFYTVARFIIYDRRPSEA